VKPAAGEKSAPEKPPSEEVPAQKAAPAKPASEKAAETASAAEASIAATRAESSTLRQELTVLATTRADAARAQDVAKKLDANRAKLKSDAGTLPPGHAATSSANEEANAANNDQKLVDAATSGTCGAGKGAGSFCAYVGAFLASGSLAWFSVGGLHGGKTSHTLVSTAIPAAGIRMPIDANGRFSIELGLMSMLISKDITATTPRSGCKRTNNDFETHLPCEGNVAISPVFGTYFGITAGTTDIGLLTLMPMVGGATTSLDGSIRPYYGIALGVVNLSKTFNIGGSAPKQ
jgi:hypothetical protein